MSVERSIENMKNASEVAGDDIGAAHDFAAQAQAYINVLLRGELATESDITPALTALIDGAQTVNARAVYRAATAAMDITQHKLGYVKSMQWQGQVLVLNKLVAQYSAGVDDLQSQLDAATTPDSATAERLMDEGELTLDDDAAIAVTDITVKASATVEAAANTAATKNTAAKASLEKSDAFAFATARDTLAPLLKFAETDTSRKALASLARLDDTPAVKAELTTAAPPKRAAEKLVSFEALIPAFTTSALRAARQSDKTVSISYAADGVAVPSIAAVDIEGLLSDTAQWIVDATIEPSSLRQSRGESGAAHIALTVTQRGSDITLTLAIPKKSGKAVGLPERLMTPLRGTASFTATDAQSLVMVLPMQQYKRREKPNTSSPVKVSA